MLRLILFVLYLIASASMSPHTQQGGGGLDPLGLTTSPPLTHTDGGGGSDPLGLTNSPPPTNTDGGGGMDPLG